MKCSDSFNVKLLTKDILHPLLQQMFKMASHCMNTDRYIKKHRLHSSIQLLYQQQSVACQARLHSVVLSMFQKLSKMVFYLIVANSFTNLLAPKPLNSYIVEK